MKQITVITLFLFTYNNFSCAAEPDKSICCIPFCTSTPTPTKLQPTPTPTEIKQWNQQQLDSVYQLPKQFDKHYSCLLQKIEKK